MRERIEDLKVEIDKTIVSLERVPQGIELRNFAHACMCVTHSTTTPNWYKI